MSNANKLPSTVKLPDSVISEVGGYRKQLNRSLSGDISPVAFKAYRVPMGIYQQRNPEKYMVRTRITAGLIYAYQLRGIARLSREHGSSLVHVTTRQDLQIHNVPIEKTADVLEGLLEVNLTARGGGGNTFRNITTCPRSGISKYQVFDVNPYAIALTEYMLPHKSSYNLPRKFKVVFSACGADHAFARATDLGFIAKIENGVEGFEVYIGGGLGTNPAPAVKAESFVPASDVFYIAQAAKNLFDKHGDRSDKHKARLRYVLKRLGKDEFLKVYRAELDQLREEPLKVPDIRTIDYITKRKISSAEVDLSQTGVEAEREDGFYSVTFDLDRGDITADALEAIADHAELYAQGIVRADQLQNLTVTSVPAQNVTKLVSLAENLGHAAKQLSIVNCTGSATCKLGLCLAGGLADSLREKVASMKAGSGNGHVIRISGCPNSCARHQLADLGFEGKARRVNGRLMPFYTVYGREADSGDEFRFAEKIGELPAKQIPAFVEKLVKMESSFSCDAVAPILNEFKLPAEPPEDLYYDFTADEPFSLKGRGPGECGAGVMDVVDFDIRKARELLNKKLWAQSALSAGRALLIIFGSEPSSSAELVENFKTHMIDNGWVADKYSALMENASKDSLNELEIEKIGPLIDRIEQLYLSLDAGLKFTVSPVAEKQTDPAESVEVSEVIDLRGVGCPLNFVKAKLKLENVPVGSALEFLLDEGEPIKNVPASFIDSGQEILENEKVADHYRIKVLRKV